MDHNQPGLAPTGPPPSSAVLKPSVQHALFAVNPNAARQLQIEARLEQCRRQSPAPKNLLGRLATPSRNFARPADLPKPDQMIDPVQSASAQLRNSTPYSTPSPLIRKDHQTLSVGVMSANRLSRPPFSATKSAVSLESVILRRQRDREESIAATKVAALVLQRSSSEKATFSAKAQDSSVHSFTGTTSKPSLPLTDTANSSLQTSPFSGNNFTPIRPDWPRRSSLDSGIRRGQQHNLGFTTTQSSDEPVTLRSPLAIPKGFSPTAQEATPKVTVSSPVISFTETQLISPTPQQSPILDFPSDPEFVPETFPTTPAVTSNQSLLPTGRLSASRVVQACRFTPDAEGNDSLRTLMALINPTSPSTPFQLPDAKNNAAAGVNSRTNADGISKETASATIPMGVSPKASMVAVPRMGGRIGSVDPFNSVPDELNAELSPDPAQVAQDLMTGEQAKQSVALDSVSYSPMPLDSNHIDSSEADSAGNDSSPNHDDVEMHDADDILEKHDASPLEHYVFSEPPASKQEPSSSKELPSSSEEMPPSSKELPSFLKETSSKENVSSLKEMPSSSFEKLLSSKETPSSSKEKPSSSFHALDHDAHLSDSDIGCTAPVLDVAGPVSTACSSKNLGASLKFESDDISRRIITPKRSISLRMSLSSQDTGSKQIPKGSDEVIGGSDNPTRSNSKPTDPIPPSSSIPAKQQSPNDSLRSIDGSSSVKSASGVGKLSDQKKSDDKRVCLNNWYIEWRGKFPSLFGVSSKTKLKMGGKILRRNDESVIMISGNRKLLLGAIDNEAMQQNFTNCITSAFVGGFPEDWLELLKTGKLKPKVAPSNPEYDVAPVATHSNTSKRARRSQPRLSAEFKKTPKKDSIKSLSTPKKLDSSVIKPRSAKTLRTNSDPNIKSEKSTAADSSISKDIKLKTPISRKRSRKEPNTVPRDRSQSVSQSDSNMMLEMPLDDVDGVTFSHTGRRRVQPLKYWLTERIIPETGTICTSTTNEPSRPTKPRNRSIAAKTKPSPVKKISKQLTRRKSR